MRIKPENTIAIAVDYQTRLVPAMQNKDVLLKNSAILLKGLSILNIPVIVTQQYTKGLGETVPEILDCLTEPPIFDKITFSCYQDEAIKKAIKDSEKTTVLICGIESHVCALQTVIDLLEDGYQVVFIEDCIDSRKINDKTYAINRAQKEGAIISTYEAILFELTQIAGTDVFKQISKLIK